MNNKWMFINSHSNNGNTEVTQLCIYICVYVCMQLCMYVAS